MMFGWLKLGAILIVAVGAGLAAVTRVMHHAEIRRKVRAAPNELADHTVVTLVGTARPLGEPLIAPLSGRVCVMHRSTARIYKSAGRVRQVDYELVEVELARFTLVTREGDVIVEGVSAEVPDRGMPIIPRKIDREQAFLAKHGDDRSARDVGFEEIVIEPGAKIAVHGIARVEITPDAGGEAGFRDAPTAVRLVGDERHPLTIVRS